MDGTHTSSTDTRGTPPGFWGRDGAGDGYRAATVCRRRHTHERSLERYPGTDLGFCARCGARVISSCPGCGTRLRGTSRKVTQGAVLRTQQPPYQHGFCDGCGEPYPWASRTELVYQLQNLLDEEEISERDRLLISEDLERLKAVAVDEDPEAERRLVTRIKQSAPGFMRGLAAELLTKLIAEAAFK